MYQVHQRSLGLGLGQGSQLGPRRSPLEPRRTPESLGQLQPLADVHRRASSGSNACSCRAKGRSFASCAAVASTMAPPATGKEHPIPDKANQKGPRVLIAGAGIGGLVLAVSLLAKGFDVKIFERDVTAIRGEGKYRGPIQVQSNALAALQAIDPETAEKILAAGCITGDRVNGLCDGETGKWYVKFDTFHPAVDKGLPVTRVVSRVVLQQLLAEACKKKTGRDIIDNGAHVVSYEHKTDEMGRRRVWAVLETGDRYEGDILVGADGIWSKVRRQLVGHKQPNYSQYTCYTGIADFTPPDIDTVGYRVFLGNGRYFVSSDVGCGKMQWYGFHKEPAGGTDEDGQRKKRLLDIFGDWTDMVTDLIKATPEEDVLRRDIFDRPPIFTWAKGNVVLLGDSAHAMQPNLGQGGCMAIEDGFQLAKDLAHSVDKMQGRWFDVEKVLIQYQGKRLVRASVIHGLAGMAAIAASTYKAYLGEGMGPLENTLKKLKIPHPGRVGGYFAMNMTMPFVLSWVLGGNTSNLRDSERKPHCNLDEAPKGFREDEFQKFLRDDDALLRAARADWLLVPATAQWAVNEDEEKEFGGLAYNTESLEEQAERTERNGAGEAIDGEKFSKAHFHGLRVARPEEAVAIQEGGMSIGSGAGCGVRIQHAAVAEEHARVDMHAGLHTLTAVAGTTWLNERRLRAGERCKLLPGDALYFGERSDACCFKVKMCHVSVEEQLSRYLKSPNLLPTNEALFPEDAGADEQTSEEKELAASR